MKNTKINPFAKCHAAVPRSTVFAPWSSSDDEGRLPLPFQASHALLVRQVVWDEGVVPAARAAEGAALQGAQLHLAVDAPKLHPPGKKWHGLPSGELTFCYGKSPFLMGKSTISTGPFSIAMLVHQMVIWSWEDLWGNEFFSNDPCHGILREGAGTGMSHLETLTWQVGNWKHVVFFPSLGPIGQFHKADCFFEL